MQLHPTSAPQAKTAYAVKISLKQYFDQRYEAGEEATKQAIIRCFRRAVDYRLLSKQIYTLELQSYTSLFAPQVTAIFAFLMKNVDAWWCDIEEQVEQMVSELMEEQLVVSRKRKFALLAA